MFFWLQIVCVEEKNLHVHVLYLNLKNVGCQVVCQLSIPKCYCLQNWSCRNKLEGRAVKELNQSFLQPSNNLVLIENKKKKKEEFYSWSGSIYEFDFSRFELQLLFLEIPLLHTKNRIVAKKTKLLLPVKCPYLHTRALETHSKGCYWEISFVGSLLSIQCIALWFLLSLKCNMMWPS